jgi:hypothetical protein
MFSPISGSNWTLEGCPNFGENIPKSYGRDNSGCGPAFFLGFRLWSTGLFLMLSTNGDAMLQRKGRG